MTRIKNMNPDDKFATLIKKGRHPGLDYIYDSEDNDVLNGYQTINMAYVPADFLRKLYKLVPPPTKQSTVDIVEAWNIVGFIEKRQKNGKFLNVQFYQVEDYDNAEDHLETHPMDIVEVCDNGEYYTTQECYDFWINIMETF